MFGVRTSLRVGTAATKSGMQRAQLSTAAAPASGGSSLSQRMGSFFAGMGVASAACGYAVQAELAESNVRFDKTLRTLEARVVALERK